MKTTPEKIVVFLTIVGIVGVNGWRCPSNPLLRIYCKRQTGPIIDPRLRGRMMDSPMMAEELPSMIDLSRPPPQTRGWWDDTLGWVAGASDTVANTVSDGYGAVAGTVSDGYGAVAGTVSDGYDWTKKQVDTIVDYIPAPITDVAGIAAEIGLPGHLGKLGKLVYKYGPEFIDFINDIPEYAVAVADYLEEEKGTSWVKDSYNWANEKLETLVDNIPAPVESIIAGTGPLGATVITVLKIRKLVRKFGPEVLDLIRDKYPEYADALAEYYKLEKHPEAMDRSSSGELTGRMMLPRLPLFDPPQRGRMMDSPVWKNRLSGRRLLQGRGGKPVRKCPRNPVLRIYCREKGEFVFDSNGNLI